MRYDEAHRRARQQLPEAVYHYYAGGAESETTLAEAESAWLDWRLRPRILRDTSRLSTATTLLGTRVEHPIGVAPWALHALADADGERATARGAAAAGALLTVSTTATVSLAEVAASTPDPKWFQLYRVHNRRYTDELARRAADAGYRALVLTADVPVLSRRWRDGPAGFVLPARATMANHPEQTGWGGTTLGTAVGGMDTWTFADIERFAGVSGLPVVVKGVLRGDDAVACLNAGAAAVWVSTHGGRQADPAVASAHALAEVVEAVAGRAEVYVDGGIRRGSDVLVALALGARAVFVGRPAAWGLAAAGADGVRDVLTELRTGLVSAMTICGVDDVTAVPRDLVTPAVARSR